MLHFGEEGRKAGQHKFSFEEPPEPFGDQGVESLALAEIRTNGPMVEEIF